MINDFSACGILSFNKLDSTRLLVVVFLSPGDAVLLQILEWAAFEVDELLLDNRRGVAVSHLDVHHGGEW